MRIVVDRDLCQGHGVCESEAPDLFSVSKKGVLTVVDESPGEERRAMVEARMGAAQPGKRDLRPVCRPKV